MTSVNIRHCALDMLARREHTQLELQRKLIVKGFASDEIARLLQELATQKLQSDERFVTEYINMRLRRGFGPIKIGAELYNKGIIKEQITQAIHTQDDDMWLELAKHSLHKKFGTKIATSLATQAKQMRYLQYKGFTHNQITNIFKNVSDY